MDHLTWEICTKHAREFIWALQTQSSSSHKNSHAADEKQEMERMATCSSTEIELDCDTPVTMDNCDMLVFSTVDMTANQ